MTEAQYIAYFGLLAEKHRLLQHNANRKCFFYIELLEELTEFDETLRNIKTDIAFIIASSTGEFNDGQTNNYSDDQYAQIWIVMRRKNSQPISVINETTKQVLKDVLARTRKDHPLTFRFNGIQYQKVAEMAEDWYGYTAMLTFTCPFGFKVNGGTWLDKPDP